PPSRATRRWTRSAGPSLPDGRVGRSIRRVRPLRVSRTRVPVLRESLGRRGRAYHTRGRHPQKSGRGSSRRDIPTFVRESSRHRKRTPPADVRDPCTEGRKLWHRLPLQNADVIGVKEKLHGAVSSGGRSDCRMARPYSNTSSNAGSSRNE